MSFIDHIFSDRYRGLKIGLLLLSILGLCLYSYFFPPEITYQMCLAAPTRYDGYRLQLAREVKIAQVAKGFFEITQGGKNQLRIKGRLPRDINEGVSVSLVARFQKNGELELLDIRASHWRRYRIAVSVVAMLVVFFLFFRRYRFSWQQFLFLPRDGCLS